MLPAALRYGEAAVVLFDVLLLVGMAALFGAAVQKPVALGGWTIADKTLCASPQFEKRRAGRAHVYYGFGLTIKAPLDFPELRSEQPDESAGPCDVEVTFGTVEEHPQYLEDGDRGFWVRGEQACYALRDVGVFLVSAGRYICVEAHENATEEALRLCILGPVLGLALQQRGFLTLHASAVSIQGAAVAFLGGHGWGKSTMAALLQARGYPVISDDLMALEPDSNRVVPSFPQLKLWPDAAGALGHTSQELPRVHPDVDKRALRFSEGFVRDPSPLRRLYLLAVGETTAIETIPPAQVFEELMRHWYGSRFGPALLKSLDLRGHFLRVSNLASTVGLRRLQRPATLLDDLVLGETIEKAILEDLES